MKVFKLHCYISGEPLALLTGLKGKREVLSENDVMYKHALVAEKEIHDHILRLLKQCDLDGNPNGFGVSAATRVRLPTNTPTPQLITTMKQEPITSTIAQTTTPTTMASPTELTTRAKTPTTIITGKTIQAPKITIKLSPSSVHSTNTGLPDECFTAINLTESWRNNNKDQALEFSDKGKLDGGRVWFRFTGTAGNMLRNTCPVKTECGGTGAYWSDSSIPSKVAVGKRKIFTAFESFSEDLVNDPNGCRVIEYWMIALRCERGNGGLIYSLVNEMSGNKDTVCGMD